MRRKNKEMIFFCIRILFFYTHVFFCFSGCCIFKKRRKNIVTSNDAHQSYSCRSTIAELSQSLQASSSPDVGLSKTVCKRKKKWRLCRKKNVSLMFKKRHVKKAMGFQQSRQSGGPNSTRKQQMATTGIERV